ncbi:hypothetical protein WMY93_026352 [Mugilogobius chulae]|uniref:Uncharacterized protein n=1 Tax=Mugilogobius chulae TaxID=88201 RepID=A0AAW0N216_9GOBI
MNGPTFQLYSLCQVFHAEVLPAAAPENSPRTKTKAEAGKGTKRKCVNGEKKEPKREDSDTDERSDKSSSDSEDWTPVARSYSPTLKRKRKLKLKSKSEPGSTET